MTDKVKLGGGPPRIAFLVDGLEDTYQYTVLRGAHDAARARGSTVLCFAGGVLGAPGRNGVERNHLYELISTESVSGAVVMSGTIGNFAGPERLGALCAGLAPLPLCSVAVEVPGIASVIVDDAVGMRKAITHLIRAHGCQRIAFVRGPAVNAEAERRYEVYRAVLAEHGLEAAPALVAEGDFLMQSGERAVDTFLDQHQVPPSEIDAIVAANDSMALGVLRALGRRSIRVPEQMALVGFDDIEDIRYTVPPLTSVRQPLYEQGKEAVRVVLANLKGGGQDTKVVLHTDLIARRSCGCFEHDSRVVTNHAPNGGRVSFEMAIVERRQLILAELSRAARGLFGAAGGGWELRLLNAFTSQLSGEPTAGFVEVFDDILHRLQQGGGDITVCHDVLSALRRQMVACLASDPERRAYAEDLFQEVRLLTGNMIVRDQARERLRIGRWARSLTEAGASLVGTFNLSRLGEAVADVLPKLGIQSAAVVLYEGASDRGELVFALQGGSLIDLPPRERRFRIRQVVPAPLMGSSYVVLPLSVRDEKLGYLLVELGTSEGYVYEALRDLFSAAVKGGLLARAAHTLRPSG